MPLNTNLCFIRKRDAEQYKKKVTWKIMQLKKQQKKLFDQIIYF